MKFLGYPHNSSGYRTYDPVTHKVEEVRAPIFWEEALPRSSTFFESQADDLDDPDEVPQPTAIAPHDNWNLPDSAETSDLPLLPLVTFHLPSLPLLLTPLTPDMPLRILNLPILAPMATEMRLLLTPMKIYGMAMHWPMSQSWKMIS